jgi:hypothetical protein
VRLPLSAPDDALAARLRGFGPLGIAAILVILAGNALAVPVSALLVLAWAIRSRTPWSELGFQRPRSWIRMLLASVALGAAFKLLMKAIVMPLLGAPPVNAAYHFVAGNTAALPGMVLAVTVAGGFGEETVFRGYLFERLDKLLGESPAAKAAVVLLTSAVFALAHLHDQGWPGVTQAAITGSVFGGIFAVHRRIWPLIFAHAAFDLVALAIIYWDAESQVAHLVFKSFP